MKSLDALASPELADGEPLLVVPIGATEQHGPHLPLGTDTQIATALASRLADRRPEAIVAPAMPFGSSGEHQAFPGTLSIGQEAMEMFLVELVRSATETFARVLLLSAHGGNATCMSRAVRRLQAERHDVLSWDATLAWTAGSDGDSHAGHTETSLMLALAHHQVNLELAEIGTTTPLSVLLPELTRSGVRAVSANGVLGDPTAASSEHGRALLGLATRALVAFVGAWPSQGNSWP